MPLVPDASAADEEPEESEESEAPEESMLSMALGLESLEDALPEESMAELSVALEPALLPELPSVPLAPVGSSALEELARTAPLVQTAETRIAKVSFFMVFSKGWESGAIESGRRGKGFVSLCPCFQASQSLERATQEPFLSKVEVRDRRGQKFMFFE